MLKNSSAQVRTYTANVFAGVRIKTRGQALLNWNTVRGPAGALFNTLQQYGWIVVGPTEWRSPAGTVHKPTEPYDMALHSELRDSVEKTLWQAATRCDTGAGLEAGIDQKASTSAPRPPLSGRR